MNMGETASRYTSKVVDARDSVSPGPLLQAKKLIGNMRPGEVLEVLVCDPLSCDDMRVWAVKAGHKYLGRVKADGHEKIFVERGR